MDREQRRRRHDEAVTGPQLKRHSQDAETARAYDVANNPQFKTMFEEFRQSRLSDLEMCVLDGSEEANLKALNALHRYQAVIDLKRSIFKPIQADLRKQAREADKASPQKQLNRKA